MSKVDIKQFKLSNDDDVICEVLHWDEDEDAIIVRGALKIINVEDFSRGVRFYAFRSWIVFQDDPEEMSTINSGHVVAVSTPSKEVLGHYASTLDQIKKQLKVKKRDLPLDSIAGKMEEMDEDEFEQFMDTLVSELDIEDSNLPGNVIKFKPKTFH